MPSYVPLLDGELLSGVEKAADKAAEAEIAKIRRENRRDRRGERSC